MARKRSKNSARAWFVEAFNSHPEWLALKSNDQLVAAWEAAHGKAMPGNIRASMATVKSTMRSERNLTVPRKGKKPGRKKGAVSAAAPKATPESAVAGLEALEKAIDKALVMVKELNVKGLDRVRKHLRIAQAYIVLLFDEQPA